MKIAFFGVFFYVDYFGVKSLRFYFLLLISRPAFLLFPEQYLDWCLLLIRQIEYHSAKGCSWMDGIVAFQASVFFLYPVFSSMLDNVAGLLIA